MTGQGKVIKDPVHGFIELTSLQEDLIEQPELQRLAWVKQLGLSFLVYPGAHQTRLEHSLGTSHIAREMAEALEFNEEKEKKVEAAAMLHDLGHGPFSHALEPMMEKDHMQTTKEMIKGETSTLPNSGRIPKILEEHELKPSEIANLVNGEYKGEQYVQDVISSQLDVDQLDYLSRDSHYSGASYGTIEIQRILKTMEINKGRLTHQEKGLDAIEDYLVARDHMYSSVYIHKTVSIAEKMLLRAVEKAGIDEFHLKTDGELIEKLRNSNPYSKEMANRLIYRNLYKQAYTVKNTDSQQKKKPLKKLKGKEEKEIEQEIAEQADVKRKDIIANAPSEMTMETEPRLRQFDIKITKENGEIVPLEEISTLTRTLKKKKPVKNLFSIYTPQEHRDKVGKATEEYLEEI